MTLRYMLDTTTVSALVREPHGSVMLRCLGAGIDRVCTSIIVAAEQHYGGAKVKGRRFATRLDETFGMIPVLSWTHPAERIYGELRADLERRGKIIGANDMLIAAHALALDLTLVSDDTDFVRVRGLKTENWL
jgi:tRNA(fMet)-specific endonuclease VapC